jgi:translocation protein SEC66
VNYLLFYYFDICLLYKANALAPNWGQTIFQSANEIAANTVLRKRLDEIQAQTQAEKEWWEKRRASIQTDFMKELDNDTSASGKAVAKSTSDEDTVLVESGSLVANDRGGIRKKRGKK